MERVQQQLLKTTCITGKIMNQSEQINELATALAKAQAEIQPAIKDSTNPFFKSKYADLSSIWNACKTPLTKNGLSVLQTTDQKEGQLVLLTTLVHSSGQWVRSCLPIISAKQDAQSIGSAITYMRRYSLSALVGVTSDEDDDGNAATYVSAREASQEINKYNVTISKQEAEELDEMLDECDDEFKKNVKNYIKTLNISSFFQLPKTNYQNIRKRILNKLNQLERDAVNV